MKLSPLLPRRCVSVCAFAALAACGGDPTPDVNRLPSFLGAVTEKTYDGVSDDLLTAGLGKAGLAGVLPAPADAARPTAAELRRAAIYTSYRALLDMTAAGGYGTLYGPNVKSDGTVTVDEGQVAGSEFKIGRAHV